MSLWIAIGLLALAAVGALAFSVRRAGARTELLVLVAIAVPAISVATYAFLGQPQLPDQPYESRDDAAMRAEMQDLLAGLQQKLEAEPDRLDGWLLLARSRMQIGEYRQAAEAFQRARKLSGDDPAIAASVGEALIYASGGDVTNDAREALLSAIAKNPRELKALYYLGHDAASRADHAAAVQYWTNLVAVAPEGAAWIEEVRGHIASVAAEGNIDLAKVTPTVEPSAPPQSSAPPPGPSAEDMAAAAEMPAEERAAFIRTMVERLEARLQTNPNDVDGWKRLANAWRVLGDPKKADEADARVRALESR